MTNRQIPGRFLQDEKAASLVEYALSLALITIVCIAAVGLLGNKISSLFSSLSTSL